MFKSGYIAILGTPNAGKSTLLNTLLGEKLSIVTSKPQTTRRRFLGIRSTESSQMIFLDTPGIHSSQKKLNQSMINEINEAKKDADIFLYLISLDQEIEYRLINVFNQDKEKFSNKKKLLVINKMDLDLATRRISPEQIINKMNDIQSVCVSGLTGEGIDLLVSQLESLLSEGPCYYPSEDLTDQNLRDIAKEMIREKAMEYLHQEIPYSLAVEIESFKEQENLTRIEAKIILEHDSQKGMVIGSGGRMIKKIGQAARIDLERLVSSKVFLDLRVKVDKNWTKDTAKLARYV